MRASLARQPLSFIENRGRVDGRVAYYADGGATSLFFTRDGVTVALSRGHARGRGWALRQVFIGGRPRASPQATRPAPGVFNSFVGPRSRWRTGVKSYRSVTYRHVWPGIDVVYSGQPGGLEYGLVIKPGADPRSIRLAYRGATALRVTHAGRLEVSTPAGDFTEHRPVAYQYVGGRRVPVRAGVELVESRAGRAGRDSYGFRLGAYDATRPVVIDPVVFGYAGFLGGSGDDQAFDVAVDQAGNAYVAGSTASPDFPATPGAFSAPRGGTDALVAKVDPSGNLIYADYIGGAGSQDTARGVAVDQNGNAYITGPTDSPPSSFPVTVGPDLTLGGSEDAFVAKLDPTGTQLLYAGYIGGDRGEGGRDIAVDADGNAYVAGTTNTVDSTFPAKVGPQLHYGGGKHDGFVAKVNPTGTALVYCSYIGGTGDEDNVRGVEPDAAGNLYITGHVGGPPGSDSSQGFPVTVGPSLTYSGGMDGYVGKVNSGGTAFDYLGYVGGSGFEQPRHIAIDAAGDAYIAGSTQSLDYPVKVGPDLTFNFGGTLGSDAFVTKVNPGGTGLVYSGFIGGSGRDQGYGLAVDGAGSAYVVGVTDSPAATFPVSGGPDLTYNGGEDAFVAKVSPAGIGLDYAGYIGGSGNDIAQGVGVDSAGRAYAAGSTSSGNGSFPTLGPPDSSFNGGPEDAFLAQVEQTCTIYWTGATSNDWTTTTNWSLTDGGGSAGRLPGASDFVCMSTSPATDTVVLPSGSTATIGGINWPQAGGVQPALEVDGTLNLGDSTVVDPSTVNELTTVGTVAAFTGETASVGTFALNSNGALDGPGTVAVTGPATLQAGGNLGYTGSTARPVHLILQGASTAGGGCCVNFYGGSQLQNQGTMTLGESANLTDADSNANNNLLNDSGATVTFAGSTSAQSATVGVTATNNGTVSATMGTLTFGAGPAGVTDAGTFTAAAGGTLDVGGTRTEAVGATVAGGGTVDITGRTTFSASDNLTNTGRFEVDGALAAASGVTVTTANLLLNGGTGGVLDGPGTVAVTGPATLQAGGNLGYTGPTDQPVHLILQGASTAGGGCCVNFYGGSQLQNQGTMTLGDNANLTDADGNANNNLLNDSGATVTFAGSTSDQSATVGVTATNNGTVSSTSGALNIQTLTNLTVDGVLTGGTYTASGGTLVLPVDVTNNAASITLGASPSAFTVSGSSTNALASLTANPGSLDMQGSLTVSGGLVNSGTVTIENSSVLQASPFSQSAGTTTVAGGSTLQSGTGTSPVAINGGTLQGTGQVSGSLQGGGNVQPAGTVAGPLTVTGDGSYDASTGSLTIPVSGTAMAGTDYGQLSATGAATLGGTLTLSTASGFSPPVGTQYTLLQAASVSGAFATVNGTQLGDRAFVISYTPTSVIATVELVPPSVAGVSPTGGPSAGGNTVTITGTNFTSDSTVQFGTVAASPVTFVSATQLMVPAPTQSAGQVDVTVTTPRGTSAISSADQYSYHDLPTVTGVSPPAGPTAGGNTVMITGTNFTSDSTVRFGLVVASPITLVSSTQLMVSVPTHSAGQVDVTVTTPGGTSATSSADQYAYDSPPAVTRVRPTAGPTKGLNTVTITGRNFTPGSIVNFGTAASAKVTFVSSTSLTAIAPAHVAGIVDVTVTTPGGTSATSSADQYSYDPPPTVTSLAPNTGTTTGGNAVTISGANFLSGATVKFGSKAVPAGQVMFVSTDQLTVVAPAGVPGSVAVTVTTPGGASAASAASLYGYGAPTVSSFTPISSITGKAVTVIGTAFVAGATVSFGTISSPQATVVSGTRLTAVVPNGDVPSTISVTDAQGTGTSAAQFTPTLSITTVSPGSGPAGTVVEIDGVGFSSGSAVKFNGAAATTVTHDSSTVMHATVPIGATSGPITVTNARSPAGTVTSPSSFTVM